MKNIKNKLKSIVLTIETTIGVISGAVTIESWVKDRYYKEVHPTKMEQNYYIYGDVVVDKTYEQRELE
ncbi:Uncharacterised protein [[Clostridium] sordellii]|uniref:hypothetical protein n=1 Tax=Paraclostridium sordellii TaxID=1505 RepID=UPI0005DB21CE|nr:hypothetical protein [Paeniclostridium sordellii]MDU2148620.1 hypothetical protein [Paeniclostridium sordellii]CEQ31859.1 Uncharacterised protein [[Clostridium] sordellii] [Paeniclostridium sordellii]